MKPIRVLQVFTVMDRGGSESMIMNYYRAIDKSKVQFDFLVHRKEKGIFEDEITSLGGKIYRLKKINPVFPKSYYQELRTFFKKHNEFSIIHAHLNTFSFFTLKIAKEYNIPCRIAHAHIAMDKLKLKSIGNNEGVINIAKHAIKLFLRKSVCKYPTHYFACGKKAGNWLFGNQAFVIMNNAIDSEKFKYDISIEKKYKKKLGIDDDIVIGHIGRFDDQKNHGFLLQIFNALHKKHPSSKLILIGDGPLKKKIEDEAKSLSINHKIEFLGVREDVPELLQVMDVFIFPSLYEGLPVTLIEAQAAGLKVLASNSITEEVNITNDLEFISIKLPAEFWANRIIEISSMVKNNNQEQIIQNNYDIIKCSNNIQQFYLNQISN